MKDLVLKMLQTELCLHQPTLGAEWVSTEQFKTFIYTSKFLVRMWEINHLFYGTMCVCVKQVFSNVFHFNHNLTKKTKRAFVFNIFIHLFSLFLFVLKFILCLFWTFFFYYFILNSFCRLTHLNKITKNDFMLYNPPGGHSYWLHQGANRQLWSNTVWGSSIFNQGSTAHFKNTHENLSEPE